MVCLQRDLTVGRRARSSAVSGWKGRRLLAAFSATGLAAAGLAFAASAHAADPAIDLGTAKAFSVLAGSGVTNTGVTTLAGSVGSYETPTITTDTPFVFTGASAENHAGDAVTQQAKQDLLVAYNNAAAALPPTAVPEELHRTDHYMPGIYRASSSMLLTGSMTLDGGGRNDGVFIFQAPTSTLTTASNSSVVFTNGAQPCNVYWQVGSSATFGTGTTFVGNVLAHTSITANTNATFEGRLLANEGAVTLDSNTFTAPACDTSGGTGTDTTGTDSDTTGTDTTGTDSDTTGTDTTGTDSDTTGTDTTGSDSDTTGTDTTGSDSDTTGTDTDTGTDSDTTGTDTDTTGTDTTGTDSDTTGTDTDTGTDSDTTGTDTDTGTDSDTTDTDSNAAADSDVVPITQGDNSNLPNTGGPAGILVPLGLLAITGGYMMLRGRLRVGKHRA